MPHVDNIQDVIKLVPELAEWFGRYGSKRKGSYVLSRSSWLDRLLRLGNRANDIHHAETRYKKPTLALWGPSQSGKSTLLAEYIDGKCDDVGNGSALQWLPDEPVRFVGDIRGGKVTVLNPFNKGSDASGCVTRYVIREHVDLPGYPVLIRLATDTQIMHSLAVGYLSETVAMDADDQVVKLDPDLLKKIIESHKPMGPAKMESFDLLVGIADTLELLIDSNIERYENLKKDWKRSLRRMILEADGLLCSVDAARSFSEKIFWDSWTSISKTFQNLRRKREELVDKFGDLPVNLSYRLAAQVLNISAVELAEHSPDIQKIIDDAGFEISSRMVKVGDKLQTKLFHNLDDFALFQGLVWEITVPLRADVMRTNCKEAADLLDDADLLDFPGVANEFKGEDLLTDRELMTQSRLILTKVLKRGKTASIAVTSSRGLNIDGFSLLMRMNRYPSHPLQLNSGIRSWWVSFGKEWPPKAQDLPLNLVLTFTAALINDVAISGVGHGLEQVFEKMRGLAYLADPKIVNTFATNYPQFPEGSIQIDSPELQKVLSKILEDQAFQRQFGENAESFREMAETGGKLFLLRSLRDQAIASQRPRLVAERKKLLLAEFGVLLEEALPGSEDVSSQRVRDLDDVITAIERCCDFRGRDLSYSEIGRKIQELINVDPDGLDMLPLRASRGATKAAKILTFFEKQFSDWRDEKVRNCSDGEIGFDNSGKVARFLTYFIESVNIKELRSWFLTNLGNIKSRFEAAESRRYLAAKMNNELLAVNGNRAGAVHRPLEDIAEMIRVLADSELDGDESKENSPYYIGLIEPFLEKVKFLKQCKASERGVQPGDPELIELVEDCKN